MKNIKIISNQIKEAEREENKMREISSIILGFENTEIGDVHISDISQLYLDGIHYNMHKPAYGKITKFACADDLFMVLLPSAKYSITNAEYELFERLSKYNDLVDVCVKYTDGDEETIVLYWEDADEYEDENKCQKSRILNNGCLAVYVGKNSDLETMIKECGTEEIDVEAEAEEITMSIEEFFELADKYTTEKEKQYIKALQDEAEDVIYRRMDGSLK